MALHASRKAMHCCSRPAQQRIIPRCLDLQHWITASAYLQLLDQRNLILAWRPASALLTSTSLHVLWGPQILTRRTLIELCSISLLQARLVTMLGEKPFLDIAVVMFTWRFISKRVHHMGRPSEIIMTLNPFLQCRTEFVLHYSSVHNAISNKLVRRGTAFL